MSHDLVALDALIAAGDDREAFARLRARLGWPAGKAVDAVELPRWLERVATLSHRRGAHQLADLATAAVRDPDSPDRLYDLGYALIDAGAPAIAATVLWRCLALVGDSEEVVCELVSALESALAYGDAFAILEDHGSLRARSFLCQYLYAFNAAMVGRLDVTRTQLASLAPDTPETQAMKETIEAIVERADRVTGVCPLDGRDLRGWHYVLTGGIVTHLSPVSVDAMHGRYGLLHDSIERVATGIARLKQLVDGLTLPCIYAPPRHDDDILAHAVSSCLGLPIAEWPAVGMPAPGLVVLYNSAELPDAVALRLVQRRPDQIVYAHASPWTEDAAISPDITTLLYQTLHTPWDRDADVVQTAARIAASRGLAQDELAADEAERLPALVARAWPPQPGARSRLWAGGPVPSSRST